jgi:APA family basic amino acid/polyamine antiporter
MRIFRTKPIDSAPVAGLKRVLGPWSLLMLGIGAIIGTGIFVLTGVVAAVHAGPALIVSFVIAGVACALSALCYAELAAMIPISGSAYSYSYATLGELFAWIVGWLLIFEYLLGVATVAVGWSGYLNNLLHQFGIDLPWMYSSAPFTKGLGHWHVASTGAVANLPAVFIISITSAVCYVGIRQSAGLNAAVVAIKVGVIVLFIAVGASLFNMANWQPFIPAPEAPGKFGWDGVFQGAAIVFFAYIGFDAVSTAAQEARNPQRDMPIGILGSLIVCTALYILVAAVLTGMVKYTELNVPAPVAYAVDKFPQTHWLAAVIKIGAVCGMTSAILVMALGQARIFFAMSQDGLLPAVFGRVHPKFQTPWVATMTTGGVAAVMAGLFPINILGELVSLGTLSAFFVVCIGVLILRFTRPHLHRPFKVPAAPLVCAGGAVACAFLAYHLPSDTWIRAAVWIIVGVVIYFVYGIRNSRLAGPSSEPQKFPVEYYF